MNPDRWKRIQQIFDGALSGPITDWLRFKVSGSTGGQGEGFFRDEDGGGCADE